MKGKTLSHLSKITCYVLSPVWLLAPEEAIPFCSPPTAIILFNPLSALARISTTAHQAISPTLILSPSNLFSVLRSAWDCQTRNPTNSLPSKTMCYPLTKRPDFLALAICGPTIQCIIYPWHISSLRVKGETMKLIWDNKHEQVVAQINRNMWSHSTIQPFTTCS